MRNVTLILVAIFISACAGRPVDNDAFARAQAACGDYAFVYDGPIGSREHQTRQDERRYCVHREVARNDADSIAFRKAFSDTLTTR